MPRLTKSDMDKQVEIIARRIRHHYDDSIRERGITCRTAAKSYGMKYGKLNCRMNHPDDYTLRELLIIANTMNIPLETLVSMKGAAT